MLPDLCSGLFVSVTGEDYRPHLDWVEGNAESLESLQVATAPGAF